MSLVVSLFVLIACHCNSLWLHAAILDLFRPFLNDDSRLRTFSSKENTPDAAYESSVAQLKSLIVDYRSRYSSSNHTMVWHSALLYMANAMLRSKDEDRIAYFLICVYSYQALRQSFRVSEAIVGALLSMGMRNGDISPTFAREIIGDLKRRAPPGEDNDGEEIRATFMADLDQSMTDPEESTAENLAAKFEDTAMITDYTNVFDGN